MTDAEDPNDRDGESAPPETPGGEEPAPETAAAEPPAAEEPAPETAAAEPPAAEEPAPETAAAEPPAAEPPAAAGAAEPDKPPPRSPLDLALLAQALIALFCVGAGVAGFGYELSLGDALDLLIDKNQLPNRRPLTFTIVAGGGGLMLAGMLYILVGWLRRHGDAALARVHQLGRFLLPLSLLLLLPYMFRVTTWQTQPAQMLMLMGALALLLEPLLRTSLAATPEGLSALLSRAGGRVPDRVGRWLPLALVLLASFGYAAFASYYTILHHQRLATACYDLGQYDNLFYNAMVGHPFRLPSLGAEQDWTSLKGHAEVGMYVLLPLYTLRPGPEILLIIQATLLGTAAIPLYLLGTRLVSRWTSLAVALCYLLYAPLHRSNFYDFHMQPIAAGFLMWMLYFLVARKRWLFWIFFLLSLVMREDISIGLTVLGMFLLITGYRPKTGLTMMAVSVTYFVVLKFGIMPRMGKWWFANIYKDLQIGGTKGYGSIIETLLSNPAYVFRTLLTEKKLAYALHILMPLAFLPIRRRYLALAIVPGFFFTLLTTGYNPTVSVGFQYNAYYIPYVFPAALVALRVLGGKPADPDKEIETLDPLGAVRRRAALGTMMVMSVIASYQFGAILQQQTFRSGFAAVKFSISDHERARYRDLSEVAAMIPPGGSVAATEHLAPHVSTRPTMYCFRHSIGKAEYIVVGPVDRTSGVRKTLTDLLNKKQVGVVAEKGGFYVLRRGEDPSRNAEVLKNWGKDPNKPKTARPKPKKGASPKRSPPKRNPPKRNPRRTAASASAAPPASAGPPGLLPAPEH